MLAASRFLARAAMPASLVCELNGGRRLAIGRQSASTIANGGGGVVVPSSPTTADAPPTSTSSSTKPSKKIRASSTKVDVSRTGFPKRLVGTPSVVLQYDTFGEDASFIAHYKGTHVTGVADGVGGWIRYGCDSSKFSSKLMLHCADIVEQGDFEPSRPDLIISNAFDRLKSSEDPPSGSSTACILVVHQKTLYSANLGDSGYLVYRGGKIIHRSYEQAHYFNTPYQLAILPEECDQKDFILDTPEDAEVHNLRLESGDLILLATDGIWDNLPESTLIEALDGVSAKNLQAACNGIALMARRLSWDDDCLSPFAEKARAFGQYHKGGKPDDITCILMVIG